MMEEIDLFDQDIATNHVPPEDTKKSATGATTSATSATATPTATSSFATARRHDNEPLRLPRTGGSGRINFYRDTLQSQIPTTEQLQKTKQQAGKVLKSFGNQFGKLNLGKLIDNMEQDQGLADSLEQLNSRMKEEVQRQEVRREAEELTLKVITDHLDEFLVKNPLGTYEEWIQDLHPENANQGQLLQDIQQIDERFYVMESDHRRLWNEAVEQQEKGNHGDNSDNSNAGYAHRLVEARTQIWGKVPGANTNTMPSENSGFSDNPTDNNAMIDLLSDSNTQNAPADTVVTEEIDFFAPTVKPTTNTSDTIGSSSQQTLQNNSQKDPFQDLLQF